MDKLIRRQFLSSALAAIASFAVFRAHKPESVRSAAQNSVMITFLGQSFSAPPNSAAYIGVGRLAQPYCVIQDD